MPIGKDSITKRVAKTTNEEKIAPELVATTAAAPVAKAPAKKSTSTAKKTTSTSTEKKTASTKKPAAKKTAPKAKTVTETLTPPTAVDEKIVETAVLANVSPETVAAVIGHKEDEKYEKVQIGQKMPDFLL